MNHTIETPRLLLISCNKEMLEAILLDDAAITNLLKVKVAPEWSEAGAPAFRFSLERISSHPDEQPWLMYLPILKSENKLIGGCSYKGKPSTTGMVEIGYGITMGYRRRGFATEMANALILHALNDELVKIVQAHTAAEENASVKVLRKCGMNFVEEVDDPEDGKLWKWEVRKKNQSK